MAKLSETILITQLTVGQTIMIGNQTQNSSWSKTNKHVTQLIKNKIFAFENSSTFDI